MKELSVMQSMCYRPTSTFIIFRQAALIGSNGVFTLKSVQSEVVPSLQVSKSKNNWIFGVCSICHSVQGSSADGSMACNHL